MLLKRKFHLSAPPFKILRILKIKPRYYQLCCRNAFRFRQRSRYTSDILLFRSIQKTQRN